MKKTSSQFTFTVALLTLGLIAPFFADAKHLNSDGSIGQHPEIQVGEPAPSSVCFSIQSNLGYGMKDKMTNGSVINLQAFLHKYGYLKVEPTGYYGILTTKAVRDFQKTNGILQTGFTGPLTRGQMKKLTCVGEPAKKDLTIMVQTDKQLYKKGETIHIDITAKNISTTTPKTLNFTNGCQTWYTIGEYNSQAATSCIMTLTSRTIPADGSYTWTMEHASSSYELPVGTHTITGNIAGYGLATTTIAVIQ